MMIDLIAESAPFTPEQRAWLNGFLAGWLGLQEAGATTAAVLPATLPATAAVAAPEPWHDPALPLEERLRLAEGEPLEGRLMAAMAQLDCGTCGYLCRSYAEAVASGAERTLTLCSPGGSDTARALKRLVKERPAGAGNGAVGEGAAKPLVEGWSRRRPYPASVLSSKALSGPGSEKETRHVEIALGDALSYEVGDSLGLYPENCDALVEQLIEALGASGEEPVQMEGTEATLRGALLLGRDLAQVTDELLERMGNVATDGDEASRIRQVLDDDAVIAGFDVLDILREFPSARPGAAEFVAALGPLQPRLYSISSSPRRHSGEVHLTVRRVSYDFRGRGRKGVASTMLADRVMPGASVRVFVQKSHGFALPVDPGAPIIMVGPGTGIAPFRAFLHERDAQGVPGKNWLFFGDQRRAEDFLYEGELNDFLERGVLTHLDTAFSRDQAEKVYVQHRLIERGAELFRWLEAGAYVYVCGDAKRMAADVHRALISVIRDQGGMSEEGASAYVEALTAAGRYRRDVY